MASPSSPSAGSTAEAATPDLAASEERPAPRTVAGLTSRWLGALALGLLTAIAALAMVLAPTVEDGGYDCGSVVAPQDDDVVVRQLQGQDDGEDGDGEQGQVIAPGTVEKTVSRDDGDVLRCTTRRQQQLGYATSALALGGLATCAGIARSASRDTVEARTDKTA